MDLNDIRNFSESNGQRDLRKPVFEKNYDEIRAMLVLKKE
jgi:hypothetical protein